MEEEEEEKNDVAGVVSEEGEEVVEESDLAAPEIQWIHISQRLGVNSTKVNGFYAYRGHTTSNRPCYLKNKTEDCWIYFQDSKTQGPRWFIGDPTKGNYAFLKEDLAIPVTTVSTKNIHVWNGKVFEEDPAVLMTAYYPDQDRDPQKIKTAILGKIETLEKISDFNEGESVFGTLKEHIEHSRPTIDVHYEAFTDGVITRALEVLTNTKKEPVKKAVYKFLALFIYYFKEIGNPKLKQVLKKKCARVFGKVLPTVWKDFSDANFDVVAKPQVLVNATLVLRNSMEWIEDLDDEQLKYLTPILKACVRGMAADHQTLSQTDREIFSGPVYLAAMFEKANEMLTETNVVQTAVNLLSMGQAAQGFKLKLHRILASLSGPVEYDNQFTYLEALVAAFQLAKEGKPVSSSLGDLHWVLWHAVFIFVKLAANDHYKFSLINLGVPQICIDIISRGPEEYNPYLDNREKTVRGAYSVLMHLSFHPDCARFLSNNLPLRTQLQQDQQASPDLAPLIGLITFNISNERRRPRKAPLADPGSHLCLCFAEDDNEIQQIVFESFTSNKSGFKAIKLNAISIAELRDAITTASAVVVGLSPSFCLSMECRVELEYSLQIGKAVFPILLENLKNGTWLSRYSKLIHPCPDFSKAVLQPDQFQDNMEKLMSKIKRSFEQQSPLATPFDQSMMTDAHVPPISFAHHAHHHSKIVGRDTLGYEKRLTNGYWNTLEEAYAWLLNDVCLESSTVERFVKGRFTVEGFHFLSWLARNNFSAFRDTLCRPELDLPIGTILHLAHFFSRLEPQKKKSKRKSSDPRERRLLGHELYGHV